MTTAAPEPFRPAGEPPGAVGPAPLAPTPEDRLAPVEPQTVEAGVTAAIAVSLAIHVGLFGFVWSFGAPERETPAQEIPVEVIVETPKSEAAEAKAKAQAQAEKAEAERRGREAAAQEKAAQEKAAQEKAAEADKSAREKAAEDAAAQAKIVQAEQERAAQEKAAQEAAAREKVAQEAKAAQEKTAREARQEKAQAAAQKKAAQDSEQARKQAEREERRAARASRQDAAKAAQAAEAAKPAKGQAQTPAGEKFARAPTGLALPFDNGPPLFRAVAVPLPTEGGEEVMSYKVIVFGMLERAKQYPESARARGARGSVVVTFSLDEAGEVTKVSLFRSSGEADLDVESLALVARAAPFPKPPEGAQRDFAAEITFDMRDGE